MKIYKYIIAGFVLFIYIFFIFLIYRIKTLENNKIILQADNYILRIENRKNKTVICDLENSTRNISDQRVDIRDMLINEWDIERQEYKTFYIINKKHLKDKKYIIKNLNN